MKSQTAVKSLLALAAVGSAPFALAHPGHGQSSGFAAGVLHPLTGADHVLAILAVGLCAAQIGGRALWLLPTTFLVAMVAGASVGLGGGSVPLAQQGIAASILVLGLLVALNRRAAVLPTAALVGFFALFHGYAHGAEMHPNLSAASYACGFLLATGALHALGIAIGTMIRRAHASLFQLSGAAIAGCGIVFMAICI